MRTHRLYFLSSSMCSSGKTGCSSKKEKEMIARSVISLTVSGAYSHSQFLSPYFIFFFDPFFLRQKRTNSNLPLISCPIFSLFCKLAALIRHRMSVFGKDDD